MGVTSRPALEVTGLVVRYGAVVAVDGVDLQAAAGEVLAVLGRNGAGKTSTIEAIEGYRRTAAGTIRVLGLDPQRGRDHRQLTRRVGVMLQRGGVYPAMGPAEALRLFARYYDRPENPEVLLERLALTGAVARNPWRRLSGGEQQRLSLALALVGRPEVVFLDEPTAGVDPQGRQSIRAVIAELRAAGVCVVLTTHELDEAERVADRIVIVDHGRVVAAGTIAELTASGGEAVFTFQAPVGIDIAALGRRLGSEVAEDRPGEYRVSSPGLPATLAELAAWLAEHDLALTDLRAGRERLEDVFLRLTGGDDARDDARP
jgi:ABC-2 type transport system ATP-binding protein